MWIVVTKQGSEIAQMITACHAIPLADCRAQGYNNGANMSGKYNGARPIIKEQFPTVIFSLLVVHANLIDAEMMPLNVFQKQPPIS